MKDKSIQIRVDEEFMYKVEYLQHINGYGSVSDTIRKTVEKEYRKESVRTKAHEIIAPYSKTRRNGKANCFDCIHQEVCVNHSGRMSDDEYLETCKSMKEKCDWWCDKYERR